VREWIKKVGIRLEEVEVEEIEGKYYRVEDGEEIEVPAVPALVDGSCVVVGGGIIDYLESRDGSS